MSKSSVTVNEVAVTEKLLSILKDLSSEKFICEI